MKSMQLAALFAFAAGCAGGAKRGSERLPNDAGLNADVTSAPDAIDVEALPLDLLLHGARLPGGDPVDVEVRGNRIVAVRPAAPPTSDTPAALVTLDLRGRWLAPSFIDSHVHLTYWPVSDDLLRGGVIGAVDLAAPEASLGRRSGNALRVVAAGPMITAVGGYPLDSWGRDGYGVECQTAAEAIAVVDRLIDAGAGLIKLPLGQGVPLLQEVAQAAIARAHERGRKVAVHALSDAAAAQAARLGADILAHTPVEPLSASTIAAWRGRTVISTLSAFGGAAATLVNLRALRAAGVTVVYGTDRGNTREPRIDSQELNLLMRAGFDGAAIIEAATATPARLWGMDDLGGVVPGKSASLLVLQADPTIDPNTLATPMLVVVDGHVQK